jgi:hypothetical protein
MHFPDRAVYCPACGGFIGRYDPNKPSPLKCRNRNCKAELEVTITGIKDNKGIESMNFTTRGTTWGYVKESDSKPSVDRN